MRKLSIEALCTEARRFSEIESTHPEPALFAVTDGKAVGTYLEQKFRNYLSRLGYGFTAGNSANGIDFPDIGVDIKVTSIRQPQSSCPFRSGRQKVFGLGYSLLVFVYDKADDLVARVATLRILRAVFVEAHRTADYQITRGIREILANDGNIEELMGFMSDRNLPVDEIELRSIAEDIRRNPPEQGYLTISNALQWRLQYGRVLDQAGSVDGLTLVHGDTGL